MSCTIVLLRALAICMRAVYFEVMNRVLTTLERAFQIAASPRCHSMDELRFQLSREGFHDHVRALFGVSMRQQLQALIAQRKSAHRRATPLRRNGLL